MTDFTITITDTAKLAGVSAARLAHNASLPTTKDGDGKTVANPNEIKTDAAYIQMVMDRAAASYAKQFETDVAMIDLKITALQERRSALGGK